MMFTKANGANEAIQRQETGCGKELRLKIEMFILNFTWMGCALLRININIRQENKYFDFYYWTPKSMQHVL